jgi:hypothetical protein
VFLVAALLAGREIQEDGDPGFSFPAPTGPYAVGTRFLHLVDESRPDDFSARPDDHRWVSVQVWYPAEPGVDSRPMAYLDRGVAEAFAATGYVKSSFVDEFAAKPTHSHHRAALASAGGPFPIVAYSSSVVMNGATLLLEELASHGYVALAIGHPYWCEFYFDEEGGIVLPDKENAHYQQMWAEERSERAHEIKERITTATTLEDKLTGQRLLNEAMPTEVADLRLWAGDIAFVLAKLEAMNAGGGFLAGRLDTSAVGVVGYSKGGAAAGQFCLTHETCRAGVNLGGFMFGDIVERDLETPFLFMEHVEPWCRGCPPISDLFFRRARKDAYLVRVEGALHGNFSDLTLARPFLAAEDAIGPMDGTRFLDIEKGYVLQFLGRYLKDLPAPMLDGLSSEHPEVRFQSRVGTLSRDGSSR